VSLLDFAEFNKYKWANYVKNVVDNAKNEGLKLIDFKNELYKDKKNSLINKKMDIIVNVNGEYKNLIYYIYKYENTKELLRVNELKINDKGNYMIKFSLYGYKK
jgi:ArsR family metal-binding transcriptional regulator